MARVLGKAGRYVEEQSVKKTQQVLSVGLFGCAIVAGVFGYAAGFLHSDHRAWWASLLLCCVVLLLLYLVQRVFLKRIDALDRVRINFRKGAVGEHLIAGILVGLPDDYVVMNDLPTPNGNFDHVVVGPNGIFAVDTKNWKGLVESDGNGELLVNGKSPTKPEVKNLVRTVMSTRDRITAVCRREYYIKAVLAFPSARVEAKWGTIKNADCVTDEALLDYITQNKTGTKLDAQEVDRVSRAFMGLSKMDGEVQKK